MKDKKIFKKWWFWLIVGVIVLGAIGSLGQSSSDDQTNAPSNAQEVADGTATLPKINPDDYKNKEGLLAYKELKAKGYKVDAGFDNQALTDMNGKASDLFEPLDPSKVDAKQSVDAFLVGDLMQNGDSVILTITKSSN